MKKYETPSVEIKKFEIADEVMIDVSDGYPKGDEDAGWGDIL